MSELEFVSSVISQYMPVYLEIKTLYDKSEETKKQFRKQSDRVLRVELDKKLKELEGKLQAEVKKLDSGYPFYNIHCLYLEAMDTKGEWKEIAEKVKKEIYINRLQQNPNELSPVNYSYFSPFIETTTLPDYSFFLQFPVTLVKPYISRDDETFHICDNPVRKDKVFKVPMVSGSTWKGNLRWTATWLLVQKWEASSKGNNDMKNLATGRLRLALLFGDEKGEEPGELKDVADYLDKKSAQAALEYRKTLRQHFGREEQVELPRHAGCLRFFPTFFDSIRLEVINPHDRKTRAGTQPIYFESARIGAKGVFSLLYVPLAYLGKPENDRRAQAAKDLQVVYEALKDMMLVYGFAAKKKAGFGQIKDDFCLPPYPPSLFRVKGLALNKETFANFEELGDRVKEAGQALGPKEEPDG